MGVSRQFSLLYGGSSPVGALDYLKTEGPMYVANRTFEPYAAWLKDGRSKGLEVIYYINFVEYPIGTDPQGWTPVNEEKKFYGNFGDYRNVPNDWWWTGSLATSGNRVEYNSGHRMLNIRPGSPAVDYWVNYIVDFWTRWNGYFDGFFCDVIGNRLWAPVWNTMGTTADAYANDGRTEAENWIRGVHDLIRRLRLALGPEPILIGNNTYETTGLGISRSLPNIPGAYTSMQKGGHPGLNGCMFEGSGHTVANVTNCVNSAPSGPSPEGYVWATNANNRKRFARICSSTASTSYRTIIANFTNISQYLYCGAFVKYESTDQAPVTGVVTGRVPDHYVNWLFGGTSNPGDTTPPTAPSAITATPTNQDIAISWTLPTLDDRTLVTVSRKATPWTTGQGPSSGTTVRIESTTTQLAAGVHNYTETNVPVGTWYYKAFTSDAAGNIQAGGPSATAQSTAAPGGGTGVFIYGPASTAESMNTGAAGNLIYGPASQVEQRSAGVAGLFVYGPPSQLAQIVSASQLPTVIDHDFKIARGLRTGSFSKVASGV